MNRRRLQSWLLILAVTTAARPKTHSSIRCSYMSLGMVVLLWGRIVWEANQRMGFLIERILLRLMKVW
uniref:Uncharacterized protein n=1 Tax=Arundo donax TaxID=35708 RepID=A0A0A9B194_ARUDO